MIVITFVKNKYKFLLGVCFYLLITANCFAQTDPGGGLCDGNDGGPDGCPLDTWVIVLVIIAVIFTALHLQRKQKSLRA
ncbi:hypothetical protein [Mucilaginibacter lappiensis]|uniref:hypothetical protein n=1 Tax=Mucilaginibacter lappiensis TaxID=354630 RepID=UPI003D1ACA43